MIELTAIFESWHIGDGNYPPFHNGMVVNLSFQVVPAFILPADSSGKLSFDHLGNAEYNFHGEVLRIYYPQKDTPLAILDSGDFRFYIETPDVKKLSVGTRVYGKGTLLLDYYIWIENLSRFLDPPDIFFVLEVTRIRKVQIPERFIQRHKKGKALPTRVPPDDFEVITELETMEGQRFDEEFYLVDFTESDSKDIPKTFL